MNRISGVAAATLAALLISGCGSKPAATDQKEVAGVLEPAPGGVSIKPVEQRQKAPSFELTDNAGGKATLADYKGKILLLNFWATWCTPCKAEIPWFQEFEKKYKDQGFAVLGVSLDSDGWDSVKPYIKERNVTYRMVIGTESMSAMYGGVGSLPTTFMIDREGKIAAIHTGIESKSTYQTEIEMLLEVKGASAASAGDQFAFFRAPVVRAE